MSETSKIEWTDSTWSPLRARVKPDAGAIATAKGYTSLVQIATKMAGHAGPHCEHVSPGCENCYSGTNNHRCLPSNGTGLPFDRRARDLVDPFIDEKILTQPLRWKQPKKIFVENQSDLFGEWVTDEMIDRVFAVMALTPWHTYQVLTKRAGRMREYCSSNATLGRLVSLIAEISHGVEGVTTAWTHEKDGLTGFQLPNVWLGVSVENQEYADKRIPDLIATPAAVRFVSYEPALGPVDFGPYLSDLEGGFDVQMFDGISWLIVGGESGPGARPFNIKWARDTAQQCKDAGVACFVKQLGAHPIDSWTSEGNNLHIVPLTLKDRKGGDILEFPEGLNVREFPR